MSKAASLIKNPAFPFILIALAVILAYFNTLHSGFILDDNFEITENVFIKNPAFLGRILTSPSWAFDIGERASSNYYRPVQYLVYMAVYYFWGLDPIAFHLLKLLLHLATALLLFLIVKNYFGRAKIALAAGLFFAVHPVFTEAVSWISGITDVLFAFFGLLCFYFFLQYLKYKGKAWLLFSYAAFFVGLFSKETMSIMAIVLFLYEYIYNDFKIKLRALLKYIPYPVMFISYFACRVNAIGVFVSSQHKHFTELTFWQVALNPINLFFMYFMKLAAPLRQNAWHVFKPVMSVWEPRMLASALFAAAFAVFAAFLAKKKRKLELFFCLWFFLALLPLAILFQYIGLNVFAERYLYMPGAAFCVLLSFYLSKLKNRGLSIALVVLIVFSYMFLTIQRNKVWRDELSFWQSVCVYSPDYSPLRAELGNAYLGRNMTDKALEQYNKAMELDSASPLAYNGFGSFYFRTGDYGKAIEFYKKAVELRPKYPFYHNNLGSAFMEQGMVKEAIREYKTAIELNPYYAKAYSNIAVAYYFDGQVALSIENCKKANSLGYQVPADFLKLIMSETQEQIKQ